MATISSADAPSSSPLPPHTLTGHTSSSAFTPSPDRYEKFPISTHLVFLGGLAAVILPVTLAPYLLTRRRLLSLQRKFNELESMSKALQKDSQTNSIASTRANAALTVERRRVDAWMQETMQEVQETQRLLQTVQVKLTELEARKDEVERRHHAAQSELQRLIEEANGFRTHGDALRALGPSLADVAAFMHEVELWMPEVQGSRATINEKSRVEQLRHLAFMLQNLPRQKSTPQSRK
ncbi:hypothetical protein GYMLUDRAFT_39008, partial [Collybiopsis luxurians FD-317 M1]